MAESGRALSPKERVHSRAIASSEGLREGRQRGDTGEHQRARVRSTPPKELPWCQSKRSGAALGLASAWACVNRLVLAQVAVEEGSNEIPAIPTLLRRLVLRGCIVTIDAISCQTAIAQAIRAQGADYALARKANQESLYQAVVATFADRDCRMGTTRTARWIKGMGEWRSAPAR